MGDAAVDDSFEALSVGTTEDAQAALRRLLHVAEGSFERQAQLQQALDSRIVIEQAKGVLIERYGLDGEAAFGLLRRASRRSRARIHDLAREVVASRRSPAAIEEARRVGRESGGR